MNTVYSHWHDSCSGYHFWAGVGQVVLAFLHASKYSSLSRKIQWQKMGDVTEYLTSEKPTETENSLSKVWSKIQSTWLSRRLNCKTKSQTFSKESVACRFSRTVKWFYFFQLQSSLAHTSDIMTIKRTLFPNVTLCLCHCVPTMLLCCVAFRSLGSRHTRSWLLGFRAATRLETQGVGSLTFLITPRCWSFSNSCFSFSLSASGTHRGGCQLAEHLL